MSKFSDWLIRMYLVIIIIVLLVTIGLISMKTIEEYSSFTSKNSHDIEIKLIKSASELGIGKRPVIEKPRRDRLDNLYPMKTKVHVPIPKLDFKKPKRGPKTPFDPYEFMMENLP